MESSYITKQQRNEVSNQVRKTHFSMGGVPNPMNTVYVMEYPPKWADTEKQPKQINTNDLQKSHFTIGNNHQKKQTTEFGVQYQVKQSQAHRMTKEERSLQRKHHFELGNSQRFYQTISNQEFNNKSQSVDQQQLREIQKARQNIRKHNFSLGQDQAYTKSTFQSDYSPKKTDRSYSSPHKKINLQNTNLVIGNDPNFYATTSSIDYSKKLFNPDPNNKALAQSMKREHFSIGVGQIGPTQTTMKSTHQPQQGGRQQLNQERLKDIQASHIELGKMHAGYRTLHASEFRQHTNPQLSAPNQTSTQLRQSHFVLGSDQNNWQTSHQINHRPRAQSVTTKDRLQDRMNQNLQTTFQLGLNQTEYSTSHQQSYQNQQGAAGRLEKNQEKFLRSSHFSVGYGNNMYQTTSQFYGQGSPSPNKLDNNLAKDIQATHFNLGQSHQNTFLTNFQADYKRKAHEKSIQDQNLVKNLRATHFEIGSKQGQWGTEYKGKFHWVQPKAGEKLVYQIG